MANVMPSSNTKNPRLGSSVDATKKGANPTPSSGHDMRDGGLARRPVHFHTDVPLKNGRGQHDPTKMGL